MQNEPHSPEAVTLKRKYVPLVVAIFAAWIVGKAADEATLPSLGYWGAFAVGLLTVAVVAPLVHVAVTSLLSRKPK